jgi:hypothetical protein
MVTKDRSTWPAWARVLTTGWVLSPLIVIALLVATFEGYGYYTRHQKTTYARGGAFGVSNEQAAQSNPAKSSGRAGGKNGATGGKTPAKGKLKNGGTHASTLGVGGRAASHGSNQGSTTPGGTTSGHGPVGGNSGSPTPTSSGSSNSLVTPRTGVYTLAVSGSESAKFGPITGCHNGFPSRATLDVHHATGESPSSYDFDMRLYPNQANKHDERHIYKYSKDAMILTYEQETVTCSGVKQSTSVSYSPAQTRVQLPLAVGNSWHNHGGGSSRTETGTSNVVKRTSLQVAGTSYQVYEIVTKLTMTGSETGERDQTWWYSPALGVPLKFSETLNGKRSGAKYAESYTASVIGIP